MVTTASEMCRMSIKGFDDEQVDPFYVVPKLPYFILPYLTHSLSSFTSAV